MHELKVAEDLEKFTALNSNYETKRDYLSLSNAVLTPEDIVKLYQKEMEASHEAKLKCYKGYQMEKDLVNRMKLVYGDKVQTGGEIVAFDGLVKGHPDFEFLGFPGDCKSVAKDEWLPHNHRLPQKVYWQIQAYMAFKNKVRGLIVYESRESGAVRSYWINANYLVQKAIREKYEKAVSLVIAA